MIFVLLALIYLATTTALYVRLRVSDMVSPSFVEFVGVFFFPIVIPALFVYFVLKVVLE